MGTSSFSLLSSLLVLFLLCVSWGVAASVYEAFLQCLSTHSQPSHPIFAQIYTPHNSSYSSVLQSYIRNLRFSTPTTPKPRLILTPSHVSHIQAAIICSQMKNGLLMKVRSGGHDYDGLSYVSDVPFFVLDMFKLRSITVDIEDESAWVEAGASVGEIYYRIAEKSRTHGFPAGACITMGAGGHFSGGGYGNMMRKYGLAIDNIVDAHLVDAKGQLLNRESMGEDLFWAIRGGGGGNYGVTVSYKIKLVRVPAIVTVFQVPRSLEQNAMNIVYQWQRVADKVDKDLFIRATLDVVNGSRSGEKAVRATFLSLFLGRCEKLLSIVSTSLPELGLQRSDCIEMSWVESVLFWANFPIGTPAEVLLDRSPKTVTHFKRKSDYVKEPIPKAGLEGLWKKMMELQAPFLKFNPYGGRMAEISPSATPFPHREGMMYKVLYGTNWNEEGSEAANRYINLTRQLHSYMTPFVSKSPRQAYVNYRDLDLGINHNGKNSYAEGRVYGVSYFVNNFERLVNIKTKVDPANFFRNEQGIPTLPFASNISD